MEEIPRIVTLLPGLTQQLNRLAVVTGIQRVFLLACSFGFVEPLRKLQLSTLDLDTRTPYTRCRDTTGLILASIGGHEDVVKLLLEAKADVNAEDNEGRTPAYRALENAICCH